MITVQDSFFIGNGINDVEPTLETTFTLYGLRAYSVELFVNNAWQQVGIIANNNRVWREFTLTESLVAMKMRLLITQGGADNDYRRVVELEAYTQTQSALAQTIYVQVAHSARLAGGAASWSAFSAVQPHTFASSADPESGSSGDADLIARNKFDYEPVE